MKIGVVFPQLEFGNDTALIKDYTQTAEGLGYEYLAVYDHVLGANPDRPGGWTGPYTYQTAFHEIFMLFAYMAALTERIEFATRIVILPQRQTALVAKQAAELDVLSSGRLRLGIGIGWNAVEYEALNEQFTNRGKRVEEQVAVMRQLWTQPLVTFQGQYHSIPDAGLNPMPIQRPIPIWFGGGADAVMRRMARIGDGWMPNFGSVEKAAPKWEMLQGYIREAGRDPQAFGFDNIITLRDYPQSQWAGVVQQWRDFGATHLCVNTMGVGYDARQHLAAIKTFKSVVG
ncbi:MAG: LLM class F420-dependent oxidoreductase [Anaerolineales bacterium]|nr:LLM class F420-dependent oxidoreductase [Anaerolineales bacterium]